MAAPFLVFAVVGIYGSIYAKYKMDVDELQKYYDELQKYYDIQEHNRTGKPLTGTLRTRRLAREVAEEESRNGQLRRAAEAQEQEWKRINELR